MLGKIHSFKRIRLTSGLLIHSSDYRHKSRKRDDSYVDVMLPSSTNRICVHVSGILSSTKCSCSNICRVHSRVVIIGHEVVLAKQSRSPAEKLHLRNSGTFLSSEHILKKVSIKSETSSIEPNQIQNVMVSLGEFILPFPNRSITVE